MKTLSLLIVLLAVCSAPGFAADDERVQLDPFAVKADRLEDFGFDLGLAMHRMQQKQLPMILVGAGLPILPRLAGESKSYAERLFDFPDIGALQEADAEKALREPVKAAGVGFEPCPSRRVTTLISLRQARLEPAPVLRSER